jgi:hypothetical protein
VRACYDCLLSYGNQRIHDMIDRHLVRDLMLRLASATVERDTAEDPGSSPQPENPVAAEFVAWLESRGLRLPNETDGEAKGTRPDLIYRLPDGNAAVFITGDGPDPAGRDEDAREVLRELGWGVITIGPGADWAAVAARYPSVFGSQEGTR